jgi:DNA mismatch repair protein MLH3
MSPDVNHYPLDRGELHQAISKRFASSRFSTMTSDSISERNISSRTSEPDLGVPLTETLENRRSPRRLERYPIYVLNVTLPPDEVDVAYEPKKGLLGYKVGHLILLVLTVRWLILI